MSESPLRELDEWVKPTYKLKKAQPGDDFVNKVVVEGLRRAEHFDGMFGYFTSQSLHLLSAGLSHFLSDADRKFRLLVSPQLSPEDREAIEDGISGEDVENLLQSKMLEIFNDQEALEDELLNNTRACLKHLIASKRLEIQIVYPKNGIFHYKTWFLRSGEDDLVLSGSANATGSGLAGNHESMDIFRSWTAEIDAERCQIKRDLFDEYWEKEESDSITIPISEAVEKQLLHYPTSESPQQTRDAARSLYEKLTHEKLTHEKLTHEKLTRSRSFDREPPRQRSASTTKFHIPVELQPSVDSVFKHQLEAVQAWLGAGMKGILAMATGAGKTITSLACARELCDRVDGPVLIIVAVPTEPLVQQWVAQIQEFGVKPLAPTLAKTKQKKLTMVSAALGNLEASSSDQPTVMVVTNNLLCDPLFVNSLAKSINKAEKTAEVTALLIGDECHRLGQETFIEDPPGFFTHRLGLSATPIRQHDPDGTKELMNFFGETVFEFSLAQAIGVCLVPYNYHLAFSELDSEELQEFRSLTVQIGKAMNAGAKDDLDGPTGLIMKRRAILENASGKPAELEKIFKSSLRDSKGVFVYCSGKDPEQLPDASQVLTDLGVVSLKVTADETSEERQVILDSFREGTVGVLLAKKVLDEGIDVPAATTAVLLASSTVEREWIQRRGRVLRKAPDKEVAEIYDILALPPKSESESEDVKKMVEQELDRVREFANSALNKQSVMIQVDEVVNDFFKI